MLNRIFLLIGLALMLGPIITPANAQPQIDYTFDVASGDWDDGANWLPIGVPTENDTATIPNGSTCAIDSTEAAKLLTIEAGGTVNLEPGRGLTLGEQLGGGDVLIIENGGTLDIQSTSVSKPDLYLYGDLDIDGSSAITFSGGQNSEIHLMADVTIDGSGRINGACGVGGGTNKGTKILHGGYDLTIESGVTYRNIGSNAGTGDNINYGTIEVDCAGSNLVEILNDGQNYGTGLWHIKGGEMKTDSSVTEWTTPGSPGIYTIEGGTWHFEGTCVDFSDTLIFKHGKFKFRDGHTGVAFENTGDFTFGGDASHDMVFEVTEDNSFEVGN